MANLKGRLIDRNRFSKRYPLIRAPKRLTYQGDNNLAMEVGTITFTNADEGTLNYEVEFDDSNYQVIAIARSSETEGGDLNVWVSAATSQKVVVNSSTKFTGYVDILAVKVG